MLNRNTLIFFLPALCPYLHFPSTLFISGDITPIMQFIWMMIFTTSLVIRMPCLQTKQSNINDNISKQLAMMAIYEITWSWYVSDLGESVGSWHVIVSVFYLIEVLIWRGTFCWKPTWISTVVPRLWAIEDFQNNRKQQKFISSSGYISQSILPASAWSC